jgi:hypothetical protein
MSRGDGSVIVGVCFHGVCVATTVSCGWGSLGFWRLCVCCVWRVGFCMCVWVLFLSAVVQLVVLRCGLSFGSSRSGGVGGSSHAWSIGLSLSPVFLVRLSESV